MNIHRAITSKRLKVCTDRRVLDDIQAIVPDCRPGVVCGIKKVSRGITICHRMLQFDGGISMVQPRSECFRSVYIYKYDGEAQRLANNYKCVAKPSV